ncbi:uncharacterized protein LOC132309878 [Cornus florida]|uniref:uncharacterized protein LOC132309878 n=1 Tax=Cornus florida TaxID=4283 RepID=UPI002899FA20|nr:uncharacterized protein LOC132309878 [Cornus florida]
MSNLTKLEFVALDISGKNYLSWILDAQIYLDVMGLGNTIKEKNDALLQDKTKAMIFLRRHISEELKIEYLTERDSLCVWNNLKERYDHQKTVILLKARADWQQLRLQDFKTVVEYNFDIFKISSTLKLCGDTITDELLLEKIFTIFHAPNVLLQQQYRERRFKKYSELISCLLVAEQNNELLLRNHQSRPTGSTPILETYVASSCGRGHGRGRGGRNGYNSEYGRGKNNKHNNEYGRGRNHSYYREGCQSLHSRNQRSTPYPQKRDYNEMKQVKGNDVAQPSKAHDNTYYQCGMTGHWQSICHTPKHLIELYQVSMKKKGKQKEMNFIDHDEPVDITNLEMNFINHDEPAGITNLNISDFFEDRDGKIDS